MPKPIRIGANPNYYLRIAVPADIASKVKGTELSIPLNGSLRRVKAGSAVKASLGTSDWEEAKRRFLPAHEAILAHWDAVRTGPQRLSHKSLLALAGEMRAGWVKAFDEDPGEPEVWQRVRAQNNAALSDGRKLLWIPRDDPPPNSLEERFGGLVDAFLASKRVLLRLEDRPKLLRMVADAMNDAARVNEAKAEGDYSDTGETSKYPEYIPAPATPKAPVAEPVVTFQSIIDKEVKQRAAGRGGVAMIAATESKFRRAATEYAEFVGSENAAQITAKDVDGWKQDMLEAEELSNNTIGQRLQNLRTVVEWGRQQGLGEFFPEGNPLTLVKLPRHQPVPSEEKTFRLDEAQKVLRMARKQSKPDLRWLPWMCAYSGARINEVGQLVPKDFFKVGEDWFYKITTMGKRNVKNEHSVRQVPVHPDLVAEGLLEFVNGCSNKSQDARMFPNRAALNIRDWLREELKITRKELAPNHGWRHLFEDLAMAAGMSDSAKLYITGRSGGGSARAYGKGFEMLPGLAQQMKLIKSILR
ncbi:DUF6538 domain-containing protein [Leisingera sp. ANG-M7]|uniref:DUF6538 domain-containing protein n=1 Tax=Leisingera sp. ANG-M7 TaxID=1577902 RepID=UPI00068D8342|nr:DUF6538 domain-containing protein [Leisingera sp. ANG-M7]